MYNSKNVNIDTLLVSNNLQQETFSLWGLKPNTKYALYVKAVITKGSLLNAQSRVTYFVTRPDRE